VIFFATLFLKSATYLFILILGIIPMMLEKHQILYFKLEKGSNIMKNKTNLKQQSFVVLTVLTILAWVSFSFAGFGTAQANNTFADCPNGPLQADLTGDPSGGGASTGTASYKDKTGKGLTISVRSANIAAGTKLTVFVGDKSIGEITVSKEGSGQLKAETADGITEGTTISVKNGDTTVMTGVFTCAAGKSDGGGGKMTPSPTATPTPTMQK
jgi:hypothetical protein